MSQAPAESALLDALKTVVDPHTGKDFVSTRALKNLRIEGGDIAFQVEMGYPAKSQHPALRKGWWRRRARWPVSATSVSN